MEQHISPEEYLENVAIVASTGNVELLVVLWQESFYLEELGEKARDEISRALPNLTEQYGLAPVKTFPEFVMAYDDMIFTSQCRGLLDKCLRKFAGKGDLRNVKLAFKKGAQNLEKTLYRAALGGYADVVNFLLSKGASNFGEGLYGAAQGNHPELIDLFLSLGTHKKYALFGAARGGHRKLFDSFFEDMVFYRKGRNIREIIEKVGGLDVLLTKNILEDEDIDEGLCAAALGGQQEYVDVFLAENADIGRGARYAAKKGHVDMVKFFLLLSDRTRYRAFRGAARGGQLDLVKFFIENGMGGKVGLNLILYDAARGGHEELIDFLLESGADEVDVIAPEAADGGHFELVKKYLTSENLDETLRVATQGGYLDLVQWLLKQGADDIQGAMEIAVRSKRPYMINFLRQYAQ